MKPLNKAIIAFINEVLNDDHGISDEAMNAFILLYEEAQDEDDQELAGALSGIRASIDATDGRFYLPS